MATLATETLGSPHSATICAFSAASYRRLRLRLFSASIVQLFVNWTRSLSVVRGSARCLRRTHTLC